ncbi:acetyltransferase [Metabacillus halosaccharovorans]|uniref:acetyltransferase n=1 Tax=Metabacillus halosaccharovorans TaxID=930124 RepID=UPI001C1F2763|nr:acetyltransferase [Metabacillus halosaccharovorans]MBU7593523.1 acetyltransferase [Metabacillus halosaccharovorans]
MNIVIIGNGGHSKVVKDIILSNQKLHIIGYLDDKFEEYLMEDELFFGPISAYQFLIDKFEDIKFIIAIGHNQIRKQIVSKMNLEETLYLGLAHPSAIISPSAKIGKGTVVMANAVINADAVIGDHVIVNTGSIIEHDSRVNDFAHISPNSTLTGCVQLGEGVHIGAGATLIPNVKVGDWSTIGAGATVINSIPSNITAVGIPAKSKIQEEV